MTFPTKIAPLPKQQRGDDASLNKALIEHNRALLEHRVATGVQSPKLATQLLPPELQRAVQILCDTYETMDLHIETTVGAAESDFITALPEIEGHKNELRQLVKLLISDLHRTVQAKSSQLILLRLVFQNEDDLSRQLLSNVQSNGVTP